jgi:hypothetical protein
LPPPVPEPEPTCVEGSPAVADAAFDKPAVADIKVNQADLKVARDYGYGYWMRFLTRYPTPMISGKIQPWYFISRLTRNNPYGNVEIGDRVLCLW